MFYRLVHAVKSTVSSTLMLMGAHETICLFFLRSVRFNFKTRLACSIFPLKKISFLRVNSVKGSLLPQELEVRVWLNGYIQLFSKKWPPERSVHAEFLAGLSPLVSKLIRYLSKNQFIFVEINIYGNRIILRLNL